MQTTSSPKAECLECNLLKAGKGTRSMGFSEDEIDFKMCNRHLEAMAERDQERREWEYYHPR